MLKVGIDIGGTFTDIVIYDGVKLRTIKLLNSTPVINNIDETFMRLSDDYDKENIGNIYHATTILTNALLTNKQFKKVFLITNKNFKDIIEIKRQNRTDLYDLFEARPPPLIDRSNRIEITGRINAQGYEIMPLSSKELDELADQLSRRDIESITICLINSYKNPCHEKTIKERLIKGGVKAHIVLSSEVDPEHREFERFSTAVVEACVEPFLSDYITKLTNSLDEKGIKAPITWLTSDGQMNSNEYVRKNAISVIESGPSAGVIASQALSRLIGLKNVITLDMGGTTAKASTITDGDIEWASEIEVAGKNISGRQIKGSGYTLRYPHIDLAEISAGGGSIARISGDGLLMLGPESAGANPGPIGYGRGGINVTLTDAAIVLGYISPKALLNGELKINYELSKKQLERKIAMKLGVDLFHAADAIIKIASLHMARAINLVTLEKGKDPRDYILMAFGGNGPVFAAFLCEELGIKKFIVPSSPGLFSALGLLSSKFGRSYIRSYLSTDEKRVNDLFRKMEEEANEELKGEGISQIQFVRLAQVRYLRQSHELFVPIKTEDISKEFEEMHMKVHGFRSEGDVLIVNLILQAFSTTSIDPRVFKNTDNMKKNSDLRRVWFNDDFVSTNTFSSSYLELGKEYIGPLIVELYDSTIVVPDDWKIVKEENHFEVRKYE